LKRQRDCVGVILSLLLTTWKTKGKGAKETLGSPTCGCIGYRCSSSPKATSQPPYYRAEDKNPHNRLITKQRMPTISYKMRDLQLQLIFVAETKTIKEIRPQNTKCFFHGYSYSIYEGKTY